MRIFAVLITLALAIPCQAGSVVLTDSGTIGGFEMTNEGISGSTATILITRQPNTQSFVNTVNGVMITPLQTAVEGPVTMLVTQTIAGHYNLSLDPATYVQTIGPVPGVQASLDFNLRSGNTPVGLPNFFNTSGDITAVTANNEPNFDYSKFAGGTTNITFTATTFSGANSFASLFNTVGATAVGNGAFSQAAIPEPTSIILLGVGLLSMLFCKRK